MSDDAINLDEIESFARQIQVHNDELRKAQPESMLPAFIEGVLSVSKTLMLVDRIRDLEVRLLAAEAKARDLGLELLSALGQCAQEHGSSTADDALKAYVSALIREGIGFGDAESDLYHEYKSRPGWKP